VLKNWPDLVTDNFAQRHTVEGSISEQKTRDVCRQRSADGTQDFTSTSLTTDFMIKIARYIAENVIEWHGKNVKAFANYKLNVDGMMWTVVCKANQGFLPTCYRDKVVVGIDRSGLINHFHGDAQYAQGRIYEITNGEFHKIN
jgi:hypothetical protein